MDALRSLIKTKKVFLWDFDGTFADTERLHYLAVNRAFEKHNHSVTEIDYYRFFSFLGEGIAGEVSRRGLKFDPDTVLQEYRKHYWNHLESGDAKLFEGVPEILKKQRENGAKVAIVSNSGEDEIRCVLRLTNVEDLVDLVIGRHPTLQKKPAPDMFLHALKMLKARSQDTLIFEDSEIGLRAAAAAKCDAFWLRTQCNDTFDTAQVRQAELTHKVLLSLF